MEKFEYDEMTRFERARIISTRALQIAMGAPLLVETKSSETNPSDIARKEFEEGVIPLTVKRPMPSKAD